MVCRNPWQAQSGFARLVSKTETIPVWFREVSQTQPAPVFRKSLEKVQKCTPRMAKQSGQFGGVFLMRMISND